MSEFTRAQLRAVIRRAQAVIERSQQLRGDLETLITQIRGKEAAERASSGEDVEEREAIRKHGRGRG